MPFSKPLYTVSYMLLSAGVSGFLLLLLYYIVSAFGPISQVCLLHVHCECPSIVLKKSNIILDTYNPCFPVTGSVCMLVCKRFMQQIVPNLNLMKAMLIIP